MFVLIGAGGPTWALMPNPSGRLLHVVPSARGHTSALRPLSSVTMQNRREDDRTVIISSRALLSLASRNWGSFYHLALTPYRWINSC